MVKKTRMTEYDSSLRSGLIAINLTRGDELVRVIQTTGQQRHRHGDSKRSDHPLLRERSPAHGSGDRGCARDEAPQKVTPL